MADENTITTPEAVVAPVAELTQNQKTSISNRGSIAAQRTDFSSQYQEGLGFFSTIAETYLQTTNIGEGARRINDGSFKSFERDYSFNPYSHYLENADTHGDMETFIKNGYFDNVYSSEAYESRRRILNGLLEEEQRLVGANTAGLLVGGLLSFIDVSTLIPGVNVAKKFQAAGKIGRILSSRPGKYASFGVQQSLIQETGLHILNDLHTMEETVFATAMTGALGGGVGIFASARHVGSPLNPKNPEYFMRNDQPVGMAIRRVGQAMSESTVVKRVNGKYVEVLDTDAGKSLSAAAVRTTEVAKGVGAKIEGPARIGIKAVGKSGNFVMNKTLGLMSPIIRMQNSASSKVRELGAKMFDQSGMILRENEEGFFTRSAETEARVILNKYNDAVPVANWESFSSLTAKLAELTHKGKVAKAADKVGRGAAQVKDIVSDVRKGRSTNEVNPENAAEAGTLREIDYTNIINRAIDEGLDDEFIKGLQGRFGSEAAEIIILSAKERAASFLKTTSQMGDELVELGLLKPGERLENYEGVQNWLSHTIRGNRVDFKNDLVEMFRGKPPEDFLIDYGMTSDQFQKLGVEEFSLSRIVSGQKQTEVIGVERGKLIRSEILDDWSGNVEANASGRLQDQVDDAEFEVERTHKEAVRIAADVRKGRTAIKNTLIEVAEDARAKQLRTQQRKRTALAKNNAEKQRLEREQQLAAEQQKLVDQAIEVAVKSGRNKHRSKAEADVKEAQALHNLILKESETQTPSLFNRDKRAAEDNLIEADIALEKVDDLVINDVKRRSSKRPPLNNRTAYLRGRIDELNKTITKNTEALKVIDKGLGDLDAAIAKAKSKSQQLQIVQKMMNSAKKDVGKSGRKAKRELKRLTKQKRRSDNKPPLSVWVEELTDMLAERSASSKIMGGAAEQIGETGRLMARKLNLTREETLRFKRKGYLSSDRFGDMQIAVNELSKRMALAKTFGHHGKSPDDIMRMQKKEVADDFDKLKIDAEKAGNPKLVSKLERQKIRALLDVENSMLRFMGRLGLPANPDDLMHFSLAKVREAAYSIHGSGFLVASQTDVANAMFTTGFGTLSLRNFKTLFKTMRDELTNPEIRRLAISSEILTGGGRSMELSGIDDISLRSGVGEVGSNLQYGTGLIDRASKSLANTTTFVSGMRLWNSRLKMLAMLEQKHNMFRIIDGYDDLLAAASAKDPNAMRDIANMSAAGIGRDQIARIKRVMGSKTPKLDENGAYELDLKAWLTKGKEGQTAYDDVMVAMDLAQSRAVMSPTMGDTPFFMSKPAAKILLQFQTYGFVIMTKFMMPSFQRMANYGDMNAFLTFGMNMMLGANVVASKDLLRGGQIEERTNGQWAYDIIDRSGYLTWASAPVSLAGQALGMDGSSRYSQLDSRLGMVLGPSGGILGNVLDVGQAEGLEARTKAALKLTPFKIHQQIFGIISGAEK